MSKKNNIKRPPLWFIIVVIATIVPIVLWPALLSHVNEFADETKRFLILSLPVYSILTGYIAYRCYMERPYIAWILIILAWLSYIAVGLLYYLT
jgi:hypothetical protein